MKRKRAVVKVESLPPGHQPRSVQEEEKKKKKKRKKKEGANGGRSQQVRQQGEASRPACSGSSGLGPKKTKQRLSREADRVPNRETGRHATPAARGSSLLEKMRARLQGGRFRVLNEKLYSCRGDEALSFFATDPHAFAQYHAGFREQVARWPRQPLDVFVAWLQQRPPTLRVADFGCGDAKLGASVHNEVVSLDLVAAAPGVIACNMAHTPLQGGAVDVAVFCLSLMGTDYPAYLAEAHRVLRPRGWLLIAEVRSRFEEAGDAGAAPLADFVAKLSSLGFAMRSQDTSNRMFVLLYLQKEAPGSKRPLARTADAWEWPALKPCMYKRR